MDKKSLDLFEKIYAIEIDSALSDRLGLFQTKSKIALKLADVRQKLPFQINYGLCAFRTKDILTSNGYKIDWDVYLPSINKNLQRDLCWTLLQKQQLILSLLKGIKIPTMAFIHVNHEVFLIIDGKQRLSACIDFVKGKFPIEWQEKSYFFDDLDSDSQDEITCHWFIADVAYEYAGEYEQIIPDEWKIKWFELINFTGMPQDKEHLDGLKNAK